MAPQTSSSSSSSSTTSTRWSPTSEQLMILEEMYKGGLKTPNAAQIHQITAHLSSYGKIEGKNVFYWFQNHKARDRQKLRRKLMMHHLQYNQNQQQYYYYYNNPSYVHHYQDSSHDQWNIQESYEIDKHVNISNNRDWMMMTTMMMDMIPPPLHFDKKAPKTLELFPVTTSNSLKDDVFSNPS